MSRLILFVLVLAIAASISGIVSAATRTTDPGKSLVVYVNISDKGIKLATFLRGQLAGNDNLFTAPPARGQYAIFEVRNVGKKRHNFAVLGKKTRPLPPGGTSKFAVYLRARGKFPYESTLDVRKAGFHGIFNVR